MGFFISLSCFSQVKKPSQQKIENALNKASKKTVTNLNIKDYPEIKKNAIAVNYSSSLYYLVRSKSDSLIYSH